MRPILFALVAFGAALALSPLVSCSQSDEPVRIGFIGTIKAAAGDIDRAARDGAQLAVAELNAGPDRGIYGQRVELIVADDEYSIIRVGEVVKELVGKGVVAIVGPMSARMAKGAAVAANEQKIPIIAPGTTADGAKAPNDYFLRISPSTANSARLLAEHFLAWGIRRVHVVIDATDMTHGVEYAGHFLSHFRGQGGDLGGWITFYPAIIDKLADVVNEFPPPSEDGKDAILLLSSPPNVAIIAQILRKRGDRRLLAASEWAAGPSLVPLGGKAVDGLVIVRSFVEDEAGEEYDRFRTAFLQRYAYLPVYTSALAYEAVMAVATALRENPDPTVLRDSLIDSGPYPGLQTPFQFNHGGDVIRPIRMVMLSKGRFVPATLQAPN